jgi:two-component system nitrogen regulation sensor histidine kinase NtrY
MLQDQRDDLTLDGTVEVDGKFLTVALHGSRMKDEEGQDLGVVLVFEDLTELLKAQKVAAWQEVARRVAHEIKNPLTPIQLSAQRMRKKFFEKAPDFDRVFDESTNVIVNEVASLKHMVDEFSKFARLPAPQLALQSLHVVVNEVVALYRGAHKDIELIVSLDEDLPNLKFDWEQLKRVLVNLLDNAIQAMNQKGRVWVTTQYDTKRRRAVVNYSCPISPVKKRAPAWDSPSCVGSSPTMRGRSRPATISRGAPCLHLNCRSSGRHGVVCRLPF